VYIGIVVSGLMKITFEQRKARHASGAPFAVLGDRCQPIPRPSSLVAAHLHDLENKRREGQARHDDQDCCFYFDFNHPPLQPEFGFPRAAPAA
jgi:hypothetical protein